MPNSASRRVAQARSSGTRRVLDRREVDYRDKDGNSRDKLVTRVEVVLTNRGTRPAEAFVREGIERQDDNQWKVVDSTVPSERLGANTVQFKVEVPAGGKTTIMYTVECAYLFFAGLLTSVTTSSPPGPFLGCWFAIHGAFDLRMQCPVIVEPVNDALRKVVLRVFENNAFPFLFNKPEGCCWPTTGTGPIGDRLRCCFDPQKFKRHRPTSSDVAMKPEHRVTFRLLPEFLHLHSALNTAPVAGHPGQAQQIRGLSARAYAEANHRYDYNWDYYS
jgi:hypothetical protein